MGVCVFHQSLKGAFRMNVRPVEGGALLCCALNARIPDMCYDITVRCQQDVTIHSIARGADELEITCEVHWPGHCSSYTDTAIQDVLKWHSYDIIRRLRLGGVGGGGFKLTWSPQWASPNTMPEPSQPFPPMPPARFFALTGPMTKAANVRAVSRYAFARVRA